MQSGTYFTTRCQSPALLIMRATFFVEKFCVYNQNYQFQKQQQTVFWRTNAIIKTNYTKYNVIVTFTNCKRAQRVQIQNVVFDCCDPLAVLLRMSWRRDVVWFHKCILARRSTSLISSGSQCCRLKVVRYRSSNCWMISTVRSTTLYHVMTSTRSATWYSCLSLCILSLILFMDRVVRNKRFDLILILNPMIECYFGFIYQFAHDISIISGGY